MPEIRWNLKILMHALSDTVNTMVIDAPVINSYGIHY